MQRQYNKNVNITTADDTLESLQTTRHPNQITYVLDQPNWTQQAHHGEKSDSEQKTKQNKKTRIHLTRMMMSLFWWATRDEK
jgi:hypothetical protein